MVLFPVYNVCKNMASGLVLSDNRALLELHVVTSLTPLDMSAQSPVRDMKNALFLWSSK